MVSNSDWEGASRGRAHEVLWIVAFLFPLLGTSVGSCIAHCPVWHIKIIGKVLESALGMKKKVLEEWRCFCIAKIEALLNIFCTAFGEDILMTSKKKN